MRISEDLLRKLASLAETDRTVFSAYIETAGNWDKVDVLIEKEIKRITPLLNKNESEYFDVSLSLMKDYINSKSSKGYNGPGLAFFADIGADFTQGVELSVAPQKSFFALDNEAIIAPLAFELDEYEPVGVIMADASGARILVVAGKIIDDAQSMRAKIHHLCKVGGWSQMRYQRRRGKQVKHFSKEIASAVDKIFTDEKIKRILLAGRDQILKSIENELSQKWQNSVIGRIAWDLDAGDDEFLRKVSPIFEKAEREQEKNVVGEFNAEIRKNGLAVAGMENTETALEYGQVDTLLLEIGLAKEIVEELTSLSETNSSHVEFVQRNNEILSKFDGIGAILRYKIN